MYQIKFPFCHTRQNRMICAVQKKNGHALVRKCLNCKREIQNNHPFVFHLNITVDRVDTMLNILGLGLHANIFIYGYLSIRCCYIPMGVTIGGSKYLIKLWSKTISKKNKKNMDPLQRAQWQKLCNFGNILPFDIFTTSFIFWPPLIFTFISELKIMGGKWLVGKWMEA